MRYYKLDELRERWRCSTRYIMEEVWSGQLHPYAVTRNGLDPIGQAGDLSDAVLNGSDEPEDWQQIGEWRFLRSETEALERDEVSVRAALPSPPGQRMTQGLILALADLSDGLRKGMDDQGLATPDYAAIAASVQQALDARGIEPPAAQTLRRHLGLAGG